jgi:opacity protein-like surface antigen
MKAHLSRFRLLPALTCWLVLPLSGADADPTFAFKLRGGLTAGALSQDQHSNQAFGFALAGRFPLGDTRAFSLELGFDHFPGQDRDVMPTGGAIYYNPQNPVTTYQGESLFLSQANSIDFRKERSQGLSLRGIYSAGIPNLGDWYWFAGASLDFYKVSAEMSGTLIPMYGAGSPAPVPDPNNPANDYYEGWAFVKDKTKLGAGLLAGVGVPISENLTFEFTIRNIGTTHFDYKPFTYTGRPSVLTESTHRGFVFEFGLAVKI